MSNETIKPDDIIIRVGGKWGDAKLSLTDWVKAGPSDRYPFQTPGEAWHRFNGVELPLDLIPHPFLNDIISIMLVLDELVPDPWPRDHARLRDDLDMFIGIQKEEFKQNEQPGENTLFDLCWQIVNLRDK
jgi:hypothetical protein